MLHHRSTGRWTLKEDVTNDRTLTGDSYLARRHNPSTYPDLNLEAARWRPIGGEVVSIWVGDLAASINNGLQNLKAEETNLRFCRRVRIGIPGLQCRPGRRMGCIPLLDLSAGPACRVGPLCLCLSRWIKHRKQKPAWQRGRYPWEWSVLKQQINSISRTSISALSRGIQCWL